MVRWLGEDYGVEPWEAHLAPLPTATATDPCPEEFVVERAPSWSGAWNVHGTGCIHAPIETVYASAQEPYTTRDPINSTTFMAIDPPMAGECDGDYQTEVFVDNAVDAFDVLFRTCWRHAEVTRSDEGALEVTATRWRRLRLLLHPGDGGPARARGAGRTPRHHRGPLPVPLDAVSRQRHRRELHHALARASAPTRTASPSIPDPWGDPEGALRRS
jgi:hypothetical protein